MKKASILAFQFADNYGAVLQIYALSEVLKTKNINVEVIDFTTEELARPYSIDINFKKTFNERGFLRAVKTAIVKLLSYKKNKRKKENFKNFKNDFLNLTNETYIEVNELFDSNDLKDSDYYIVGSDQVWNPAFYGYAVEAYFLQFAPKKSKKIAYAASIANELDRENLELFRENLKHFDFISVREESAKNQIIELTNKPIEVTLDPSLLLTKDKWKILYDKEDFHKKINEKYIFVYDLVTNSTIIELANKLAKQLNARIISYSGDKSYENLLFSFDGVNPTHFLELIHHAEFVITSSFHGTAFSLIYEKDFYTVPHPTRGSRMIDLLTDLDLDRLLVNEVTEEVLNLAPINYEDVNIKLNEMRNKSFDFIYRVL